MHSQNKELLLVQCSLQQTESSGPRAFCVPHETSAGLAWGRPGGCRTARTHCVPAASSGVWQWAAAAGAEGRGAVRFR